MPELLPNVIAVCCSDICHCHHLKIEANIVDSSNLCWREVPIPAHPIHDVGVVFTLFRRYMGIVDLNGRSNRFQEGSSALDQSHWKVAINL